MRILLDPQIFNNQKYGGISRYYSEIFVDLKTRNGIEIQVPLIYTNNIYFSESSLITKQQKRNAFFFNLIVKAGISIRKKTRKLNCKKTIEALKKQDFDLFIPTYYDPYFLDYIGSKPFVLTVYDMIHELFPLNIAEDAKLIENKLLLMEKATRIIAVSHNTKRDILNIYPHISESKIDVIYHGNSIVVNKNAKIDLPSKYILFVGPRFQYKNFKFFIEEVAGILERNSSLYVVCAGGGKFKKGEKEYLSQLKLTRQVIQVDFEEKQLGLIYNKAICFVFPSIYEGFGIPVLESMASGCPIILGNHSSFPEVAGEAGVFFDLKKSGDLESKINLLIQNVSLRQEYSLKGIKQAEKFNWNNAANECLNVYIAATRDINETK
ncbi:glycosyltransferase family 4 protein [Flavobacterium aquiphilum]|uniref:glycosyltransferase family 4 protein n=1 Tax=Flavobacterium aquiphilum TaxID=3003261 RepID=UPI002480C66E|nr:glycosyltransferase family 1 protein [Flavobacterium aquiphilum]